MDRMRWRWDWCWSGSGRRGVLLATTALALLLGFRETGRGEETGPSPVPPPALERPIPEGPLGDVIRLGEELVARTATHEKSRKYVGGALHCTSCHLKNGTDLHAASFLGIATAYPAWSPREKRVITLEDRVLNCFMRSCNGVRPPLGSEASVAITAYITWLSTAEPIRMNPKQPKGPRAIRSLQENPATADRERGRAVYARRCAECHAEGGQGDETNPPLWGTRSYNTGAGFADAAQLAAWVKVSMPLDDATLTEREALDVAVFINSHERPRFVLQEHLPDAAELGRYNGHVEP